MSIPLATTALTVTRLMSGDPNSEQDLDSETDYVFPNVQSVDIAVGLRANLNAGSGVRAFGAGGERERVMYRFQTDPIDGDTILGDDVLTDSVGQVYTALWCRARAVMGISYLEGECFQEIGAL
jgi:hypothetical protein